uniref:Uncharacterized protein n=1 Tax=Ananas comosus var. bracteatus TaxID=296719 RepID=A0A6V7PAP9_ANACO|nr:unnamed protein product [Ananas comosus var. bracteatus]
MAAVVVQICFRDFLRIVCQRFSVAVPVYGIPVENEGLLSVYVEVEVPKGETVTEAIRCWGMPCSTVDETEEDAACRAVARLRDEFGFGFGACFAFSRCSHGMQRLHGLHHLSKPFAYKQIINSVHFTWVPSRLTVDPDLVILRSDCAEGT